MAIANPVEVYGASTTQEAQLIKELLGEAAVHAEITEDVSADGEWMGATPPGTHLSRLWVDDDKAEEAAALIAEYETRRDAELAARDVADAETVEARCEECGKISGFPAGAWGSVQACPDCGAAMDVGPVAEGDWWKGDGEEKPSRV